jgi:IclR family pca regulon transcriptional regulator
MTVSITIGTRFPAYSTSMGRVLLAGLSEAAFEEYLAKVGLTPLTDRTVLTADELREQVHRTRESGYCLVDQELEQGLRSMAAPIRDHTGTVCAAVNISTHAARYTTESVRADLLPPLLATAAAISTDLAQVQNRA